MRLLLNQEAPPAGGNGAPPAAPDWTTGLPDDAKPFVQAKGWKSPADAITSYRNLEKVLGNNIPKPQPTWKDEEWGEFYKHLRPEAPDKYDLPLDALKQIGVEGDPNRISKWRENFHKHGLSDRQAKAIWNDYLAEEAEIIKAEKQSREVAEMKLRNDWGAKYDTNLKAAQAAVEKVAPELKHFITQSGLGNHPEFVKLFHSIASKIGEDKATPGSGSSQQFGMQPADAEAEINKLKSSPLDGDFWKALKNADHPKHKETAARWAELHKIAFPPKAAA